VKFEVVRLTPCVGNFSTILLPYYPIHRNWQGPTLYASSVLGQNMDRIGELGLALSHKCHSNFIPDTLPANMVTTAW